MPSGIRCAGPGFVTGGLDRTASFIMDQNARPRHAVPITTHKGSLPGGVEACVATVSNPAARI